MAAPRQQTLMQKFGFNDPDLKTPKHDAIMCWLDDNAAELFGVHSAAGLTWAPERVESTARAAFSSSGYAATPMASRLRAETRRTSGLTVVDDETMERAIEGAVAAMSAAAPAWPGEKLTTTWESPVKRPGSTYTIGYIDLKVAVDAPRLYASETDGAWHIEHVRRRTVWCEVKSTIPSIGELMRQLQTYADAATREEIVVVSPDTRHRARIEAQGYDLPRGEARRFGFIEVPPSIGGA